MYVLLVVLGYLLIEEVFNQKASVMMNKKTDESSGVIGELGQLASLIAQGVGIQELLQAVTQKSRVLTASDIAYLLFRDETNNTFYIKALDSQGPQDALKNSMQQQVRIFEQLMSAREPLLIDKDHASSDTELAAFLKKLAIRNSLAMPVYSNNSPVGILGIGNDKDGFLYQESTTGLLDLLSKQTAIAIEQERLKNRLEKLEIKDTLTGLYNKMYILLRLQEEIRRAVVRQRPCSFLLLDVDNFQRFRNQFGLQEADDKLRQMASLIRNLVSEIDPVAKFGDNQFAIVFPERNKRQAHEEADEIRKIIERTFGKEQDSKRRLTVSGGISENPLDGVTAQELVTNAEQLLLLAKRGARNTILV